MALRVLLGFKFGLIRYSIKRNMCVRYGNHLLHCRKRHQKPVIFYVHPVIAPIWSYHESTFASGVQKAQHKNTHESGHEILVY